MNRNQLTVFEHEVVRFDKGEKRITKDQFLALQHYYGENGVPFFSLVHNGIKFTEYVGVIQVGNTLIEILPKADKNYSSKEEENRWRNILIGMLRSTANFNVLQTGNADLKITPNTILDLYIELFIKELEYLLHNGLVKKYRKTEGNVNALKGNLLFSKNLQNNLAHQERFFVSHTIYDVLHKFHLIIYKTLRLLKIINTHTILQGRICALLLYFPEMPDIKISEQLFNKLNYNRKTQSYKSTIDIAKLLLLQYHPDVSKGRNNVLTLVFDMNKLWEQFVYLSLKKQLKDYSSITSQTSKYFWQAHKGSRTKMRPDIFISKGNDRFILDTKWKNLNGHNPSSEDLRQMYVYHEYYDAKKVALVYPSFETKSNSGNYLHPITSEKLIRECSIISISVEPLIKEWQKNIANMFDKWMLE